jgi:hypothetical protein
MRRIAPMIFASLCVACSSPSLPSAAPIEPPVVRPVRPAQWALDWADEFEGATLDASNWIAVDGVLNGNDEM